MKSLFKSAWFILFCTTCLWLVNELADRTPPPPESPADTRVQMFLEGRVNFVDEADLENARPELREAAYQLLD